jgi:hypothetical protein
VRLDPRLAAALELPVEVTREELGERFAIYALARPPREELDFRLWERLAEVVTETVLHDPPRTCDSAETAHLVFSELSRSASTEETLAWEIFGGVPLGYLLERLHQVGAIRLLGGDRGPSQPISEEHIEEYTTSRDDDPARAKWDEIRREVAREQGAEALEFWRLHYGWAFGERSHMDLPEAAHQLGIPQWRAAQIKRDGEAEVSRRWHATSEYQESDLARNRAAEDAGYEEVRERLRRELRGGR